MEVLVMRQKISEFLSPANKEKYKREAEKTIRELTRQLTQLPWKELAPLMLQLTSAGETLFHSHQLMKRSRAGVSKLREGDLRASAEHAGQALLHAIALYRKGQFRGALKWSKIAQKAWDLALESDLKAPKAAALAKLAIATRRPRRKPGRA